MCTSENLTAPAARSQNLDSVRVIKLVVGLREHQLAGAAGQCLGNRADTAVVNDGGATR